MQCAAKQKYCAGFSASGAATQPRSLEGIMAPRLKHLGKIRNFRETKKLELLLQDKVPKFRKTIKILLWRPFFRDHYFFLTEVEKLRQIQSDDFFWSSS